MSADSLAVLTEALAVGDPYLDLTAQRELSARIEQRHGLPRQTTVVALAGGTGSGKSSLVNALLGENLAVAAPTRPTTKQAQSFSNVPATEILNWLQIANRHQLPIPVDGELVLVDLPDIDSTEPAHRDTADRLIQLADLIIWVLDPQKYADATVHNTYLSTLGEYSGVSIVVLNQIDLLRPGELENVTAHLSELLAADGLSAPILTTSALTGAGIVQLREQIFTAVAARTASAQRVAADLRTAGRELIGAVTQDGGKLTPQSESANYRPALSAAVAASGTKVVAKAAGDSYRLRGKKVTSWPVAAWLQTRKIDPLRRLRLAEEQATAHKVAPVTGITVSPALQRNALVAAENYLQEQLDELPRSWARTVSAQLKEKYAGVLAGVDALAAQTDLAQRKPMWWRLIQVLQYLLLAVSLAGGLWLLGLIVGDLLQFRLPEPPAVGIVPVPTALLVLGILSSWILALLCQVAVNIGAKRVQNQVTVRMSAQLDAQLQQEFVQPASAALAEYRKFLALAGQLSRSVASD
ncbi:MAG: 50S ribosome-binding GTPase [Trueperella sp.]|nr:50S ribosome-binding GTPase [Trueperella sp.]